MNCRITSYNVCYTKLLRFDAIRERVALRLDPDRRSLDILEQFMDNLSERRTRMDHAQDALVLDAYWQAIGDVEAQVPSFRNNFV